MVGGGISRGMADVATGASKGSRLRPREAPKMIRGKERPNQMRMSFIRENTEMAVVL